MPQSEIYDLKKKVCISRGRGYRGCSFNNPISNPINFSIDQREDRGDSGIHLCGQPLDFRLLVKLVCAGENNSGI